MSLLEMNSVEARACFELGITFSFASEERSSVQEARTLKEHSSSA